MQSDQLWQVAFRGLNLVMGRHGNFIAPQHHLINHFTQLYSRGHIILSWDQAQNQLTVQQFERPYQLNPRSITIDNVTQDTFKKISETIMTDLSLQDLSAA